MPLAADATPDAAATDADPPHPDPPMRGSKNAYSRYGGALPSLVPSSPRSAARAGGGLWGRRSLLVDAALLIGVVWALVGTGYVWQRGVLGAGAGAEAAAYTTAPILVSYSYYEKDPVQVRVWWGGWLKGWLFGCM